MFGNILKTAFRLVPKQRVNYYQFKRRYTNDFGKDVSEYEQPILLHGSLQQTANTHLQLLGLDANKEYVTFYCIDPIFEVARDTSGDQFEYGGTRYQVLNRNNWIRQDGWNGVVAVRIYERK